MSFTKITNFTKTFHYALTKILFKVQNSLKNMQFQFNYNTSSLASSFTSLPCIYFLLKNETFSYNLFVIKKKDYYRFVSILVREVIHNNHSIKKYHQNHFSFYSKKGGGGSNAPRPHSHGRCQQNSVFGSTPNFHPHRGLK